MERYTLPRETILECARLALESGYGSVAIQAGERRDPKWVTFIGELLRDIHEMSCTEALPQGLGITLSLGEQSLEVYEYWAEASGNPDGLRYLLRSNRAIPNSFTGFTARRASTRRYSNTATKRSPTFARPAIRWERAS